MEKENSGTAVKDAPNDERLSTVLKTKQEIAKRNKNNEAMNSHVITLRDNMLGLVVVYRDGTYDKHVVGFNRQAYMTILNSEEGIIRFRNKTYKLVQIQGEK